MSRAAEPAGKAASKHGHSMSEAGDLHVCEVGAGLSRREEAGVLGGLGAPWLVFRRRQVEGVCVNKPSGQGAGSDPAGSEVRSRCAGHHCILCWSPLVPVERQWTALGQHHHGRGPRQRHHLLLHSGGARVGRKPRGHHREPRRRGPGRCASGRMRAWCQNCVRLCSAHFLQGSEPAGCIRDHSRPGP